MSYILEALKKADAERERGAVPDLHAQQQVPLAAAYEEGDDARPSASRPWLWLAAGALIAIAMAAGFAWLSRGTTDAPPPVVALPVPPPPPSPPTRIVDPAPPPRQEQQQPREAAPVQAPRLAPAPPSAEPRPRKPAAAPPTESRASAPAAPTRVPSLNEMPDDVRRQAATLAIGGAVYSPQPANRMLIVNGLVVREGSTVGTDLRLEQIGPKSAVFSLRGQRFEVPF